MSEHYLCYADAAEAMGIARRNVARLVALGRLEVVRPEGKGPGRPVWIVVDQPEVQKRLMKKE